VLRNWENYRFLDNSFLNNYSGKKLTPTGSLKKYFAKKAVWFCSLPPGYGKRPYFPPFFAPFPKNG